MSRSSFSLVALALVVACAEGRRRPDDAPPRVDAPTFVDAGSDGGVRLDAPALDAPIALDARMDAPMSDARIADAGGDAPRDGGTDARDGGSDGGGFVPATWTTTTSGLACTAGTTYRFRCPPAGTAGSLWGTGEYTSDSSVCNAAAHAGRITRAAGGDITVAMRPGRSSYLGSTRNGITSSSYGGWSCSFAVTGPACPGATCSDVCIADPMTDAFGCGASCTTCAAGQACAGGLCTCPPGQTSCPGGCVDTMTSAMHCGGCTMPCPATQVCAGGSCGCPPARTLCPSTGDVCIDTTSDAGHCGGCGMPCGPGLTCAASTCGAMTATWSTTATGRSCPADVGLQFTYGCPAGGTAGSLWGTDTYTHDSSICTAAVHSGRITLAGGGAVTIEMAAGAASYTGSLRNGITSSSYGSWSCSFIFP